MLISEFPISKRAKSLLNNAGFITEEDLREKFIEDLKAIEGFGPKMITETRDYLYGKFQIILKHKPKDKKIKNFRSAQELVSTFLSHSNKIYWPKEIVSANNLLKIYDIDFLRTVKPNRSVYTLSYYFTDSGKKYLKQYKPTIGVYTSHDNNPQPEEEVEEVVELKPSFKESSPRSLRDFLSK